MPSILNSKKPHCDEKTFQLTFGFAKVDGMAARGGPCGQCNVLTSVTQHLESHLAANVVLTEKGLICMRGLGGKVPRTQLGEQRCGEISVQLSSRFTKLEALENPCGAYQVPWSQRRITTPRGIHLSPNSSFHGGRSGCKALRVLPRKSHVLNFRNQH